MLSGHGDDHGFSGMTTVSTFRAAGLDGKVWLLEIGDAEDPKLFRDDAQVSGFLPPREWTEDRVRSALMLAGVGGAAAEKLAEQVMAE
jgi:hypothetical protein